MVKLGLSFEAVTAEEAEEDNEEDEAEAVDATHKFREAMSMRDSPAVFLAVSVVARVYSDKLV